MQRASNQNEMRKSLEAWRERQREREIRIRDQAQGKKEEATRGERLQCDLRWRWSTQFGSTLTGN